MTNADFFKDTFGMYASEIWAMPEKDFVVWLNSNYLNTSLTTCEDKVIAGLKYCREHGSLGGKDCNGHYERYTEDGQSIALVGEYRSKCPYGRCTSECIVTMIQDAIDLLGKPTPCVKHAQIQAWRRIGDLAEAIFRQYQSDSGSESLCKSWAQEIVMQCDIIHDTKGEKRK